VGRGGRRRLAYPGRGHPSMPETLVAFTLEPVEGGTRLRLEHTGFAAAGPEGRTIRDILASGWGSKLLRETLPALLDELADHPMQSAASTREEEPCVSTSPPPASRSATRTTRSTSTPPSSASRS